MRKGHAFVWGAVVGVAGTWAYHAFFRQLPAASKTKGA